MTAITGSHRVHHSTTGMDRMLVKAGLALATWAGSREHVRAVHAAHYQLQQRRYEQLRDRMLSRSPVPVR